MAVTAIALELVDQDARKAKPAARIPPACRILPTAIEVRAKTLRCGEEREAGIDL